MPLKFGGRRKSSANILDSQPEPSAPAQSSFRVLERRNEPINLNSHAPQHGNQPSARPFASPLDQLRNLRGKSVEELGSTLNRGSGGTTASGSSGYYDSSSASARHSSSSTLPSSVDAEPREEELFSKRTKTATMTRDHATDIDEVPAPPKSFSSRAARALSFGQKHKSSMEAHHAHPIPPAPSWPAHPQRSHSPQRDRALTTSSYASTAKPEPLTLSADFGSDFGNMFAPTTTESPSPPPPVASQHKTESQPIYPPRTISRNNFGPSRPSPDFSARERNDAGSPYSWDHRNSNDALMSSSALSSPRLDGGPPAPPQHGGMSGFMRGPKAGYALVSDRPSPGLPPGRLSQDSRDAFISDQDKESEDEYASDKETDVKRVQLRDTQPQPQPTSTSSFAPTPKASLAVRRPSRVPSQATAGASRAGAMSPVSSEGGGSLWGSESINATPKAGRMNMPRHEEESLFDSSPKGPPSMAIRPGAHTRTESDTPKKMTKAQFERLQRGGDSSAEQSEDENHSDDDYEDEDDAERAKKLARQRQKQEANMSVYRQQMKKVTGGGPSDLPSMARPSMDRASSSAPAGQGGFHLGGMGGQPPPDTIRGKQSDEDDDDVPLGILQAHGFPNGARPPTRQDNDNTTLRRASTAGSVMGGGAGQGNLPPFARRLPADPYFGSSLVNQTARESLGMSGTPSVYGGAQQMQPQQMMPQMGSQTQPQMGHPGGLVGVIAGEERAKAARRGSPNPATGAFNPLPQNMPNMPRTMSMGNYGSPQVYTPSGGMSGMPPMPQMAGTPGGMMPGMMGMPGMPQMPQMQNQTQDQMQKFMEMQMQIMQNMLSMQQVQLGQTPQPQQNPTGDYLGFNFQQGAPSVAPSVHGGPAPSVNQGRAMTMMNPPKGWDTPPGGIRPNSAMPATYTPSTYNAGGPGAGYTPSIAPSERSNVGMPSRYRPVETNGNASGSNAGRSQSMTSSMTLQAFGNSNSNNNNQLTPDYRPQAAQDKGKSSTIRMVDKPKGAPKISAKPVVDDEDEDGWAEMKKKREDKKKFRFGKRSQTENTLADVYNGYE